MNASFAKQHCAARRPFARGRSGSRISYRERAPAGHWALISPHRPTPRPAIQRISACGTRVERRVLPPHSPAHGPLEVRICQAPAGALFRSELSKRQWPPGPESFCAAPSEESTRRSVLNSVAGIPLMGLAGIGQVASVPTYRPVRMKS